MNLPARLLVLVAVLLTVGCLTGSDQVQGFAPRLELEALRIDNDQAELVLLLLNPNDHPVVIESGFLVLMLDNEVLIENDAALNLDVGPRNRERIRLRDVAGPAALERLRALQANPEANLRYELSSELTLVDQRNARSRVRGFIHPVPGQPGSFR